MIEKIRQGNEVPFTQISNALLADRSLSLKQKGLLAYMLSKPTDWQFNIKSMAAELLESKNTVGEILKSLLAEGDLPGYVHRFELRDKGRFVGYEYIIYQSPRPKNSNTEDTPKPKKPVPVFWDIPNKELTNKEEGEGGSSAIEPSRKQAPPDPEIPKDPGPAPIFEKLNRRCAEIAPGNYFGGERLRGKTLEFAEEYGEDEALDVLEALISEKTPDKFARYFNNDYAERLDKRARALEAYQPPPEPPPKEPCPVCGELLLPDDDICPACRMLKTDFKNEKEIARRRANPEYYAQKDWEMATETLGDISKLLRAKAGKTKPGKPRALELVK